MAGILRHSRELTAFTNPLPNSYLRFGCDEAPRYVSWSRQNRSQLVRIPQVKGDNCRMELRSPDPACQPLPRHRPRAGSRPRRHREPDGAVCPCQPQPLHPAKPPVSGLETLPASLEEAVEAAKNSEFLHKFLPDELSRRYYAELCAAARRSRTPPTPPNMSASTTSMPSDAE